MHRLRRQTVRPRAAIRVPLLTFPLVFAVTALIVAYWGRDRWIPVNEQTTYTTTVRAVETASSAATPFTVTDSDPQRAKASADALAERFAAQRVAKWRRNKADESQRAHDLAEKARQKCRENADLLSALERQRPEKPPVSAESVKPPPQPEMIDNPLWLDLHRQIGELEARREQLLIDRTPRHPAVREIDERLAETTEQLAATARRIPDSRASGDRPAAAPAIVPPASDGPAARQYEQKLAELTAALEKSRLACQQAERAEEQAGQQLAATPQFTFAQREIVQNLPQTDYGWYRLLWTTFASGLLMAVGVCSVFLGTGIDPPVASIDEIEEYLNEPILGTLPSDGPPPNLRAIDRETQLRRAFIAFGTILILACPVVAVWGIAGICGAQ